MKIITNKKTLRLKWVKNDTSKTFKMHQCYEKPGSMVSPVCEDCEKSDFDVAAGNCFTVIRCRNCEKEACIHDG